MNQFSHLFSPLPIAGANIRNRIVSTGHDTVMAHDGQVTDRLIAYHQARARGGAGLIITQVAGVHETARYTSHILMLTDDSAIAGFARLARAVKGEGASIFGQLFHPGREIMETQDGTQAIAYAPSAVPNSRFHVMPAPLSRAMIEEIIDGYANGARRLKAAGYDGCEIVASHGYLPAQFLNPHVNLRDDEYGGSAAARLRFIIEVAEAIRASVGPEFAVGLRISGDEHDRAGLEASLMLEACGQFDRLDLFDFYNVVAGTSASLAGAIHIVPPMMIEAAYVAPFAGAMKQVVKRPVFVAGRINQPQMAESILATGQADMCGMTRALIADPEMPNKAARGELDDIRACIACNQACIGHFHKGYPISCIQFPETGRELTLGVKSRALHRRKILVVGGGPAGMKAASVAAEIGHEVHLHEASPQLGGQALLAQLLPGRSEFGGIVTNFKAELRRFGVQVFTSSLVSAEMIHHQKPDAVVIATGALARVPQLDGLESANAVTAWAVLKGEVNVGASVVIADWKADWIGLGLAEKLARDGCNVTLCVEAIAAGETLPLYVRDHLVGKLHHLGVKIVPYARLFGMDGRNVYFEHAASGEAMIFDDVDTLILAQGAHRQAGLYEALENSGIELHLIGDALTPRTAEEAVLEGLKVGRSL